ncbi:ABC transporter ATP-binding protein [Romboutsia lituseburensis]|uniref:ABC transporter ATP-binding protein n=1 Tax=Romboutsia lituseburensis TaxID=1537 RepID=UPI00215ABBFE|nr:ABC transporter ATP-binding protein/permease [Romboutsia lituseburensis]MCR8744748.1 ABC transporter ATP-binding protein/permease [Romboutsia lituseburensis]
MVKLLKGLKSYLWIIVLIFVLVFLQSLSDVYLPNLMSDIVDKGVINKDTNYIINTGFKMILVTFLGGVVTVSASYFSSKVAMGFGRDLRNKVFDRVENFSLQEFNQIGTASLITRTTNDITQIQQVVMIMLRMMLYAPMVAIGATIMAVRKDAKLSLIILVAMPILIVSIGLILKRAVPLFKSMQKRVDNLNRVLRENLIGVRVIRVFNKVDLERKRFKGTSLDLCEVATKANQTITLLMPLMMLVVNISIISVVWFGGIRIDKGEMQVGDLMAFIQYLSQIMFALMMLSMMFVMIPRASASATRINEILDIEKTLSDKENAIKNTDKKGFVEFKNVSFSYEKDTEKVLNNISFVSKPGEVTAIIGGTGSGKSTLVKLIPRFFDTTEGEVLVDGVNIRDLNQHVLRSKIGYVPQKAILFSGTIFENLKYGKENATEEEVKKAIEIAQAKEFVDNMEEKENSFIAQGGTNVSGGQKQRLSIARAIIKKTEIYIFDDSFSALDFKTDAALRASLLKETKESTVILVAQRVSTVMDATRIIVLDDGRIAGIGTHDELLKTCDIYNEIVSSQLSKEEM